MTLRIRLRLRKNLLCGSGATWIPRRINALAGAGLRTQLCDDSDHQKSKPHVLYRVIKVARAPRLGCVYLSHPKRELPFSKERNKFALIAGRSGSAHLPFAFDGNPFCSVGVPNRRRTVCTSVVLAQRRNRCSTAKESVEKSDLAWGSIERRFSMNYGRFRRNFICLSLHCYSYSRTGGLSGLMESQLHVAL